MGHFLDPEQSDEKREQRREHAAEQFAMAQEMAARGGLRLRQVDETHYQLTEPKQRWLLNIYPGNRRLYRDRNRPAAPYLDVRPDWTLLDVVYAAIPQLHPTDFFHERTNDESDD